MGERKKDGGGGGGGGGGLRRFIKVSRNNARRAQRASGQNASLYNFREEENDEPLLHAQW